MTYRHLSLRVVGGSVDGGRTLACATSPLLGIVVRDENWHGVVPPNWFVGREQRPAQTQAEAFQQRQRSLTIHRRHGGNSRAARQLIQCLETCTRDRRCASGTCAECGGALQRWFVASAAELLISLGVPITIISLVIDDVHAPVGKLTPHLLHLSKKRVLNALRRVGIQIALGGIDISANEHEEGLFRPMWRPQAWLLAQTNDVRCTESDLRRVFPASDTTKRPVTIHPWDGDPAALAYALKTSFDRRVTYWCGASEHRDGHWNSRHRPLRVEQHVELAVALHRAGLQSRLLLRGCRVVQTSTGPRIRLIGSS